MATVRRVDAAQLPLCLLTPEMQNRSLADQAFAQAGATVAPVMETSSVLALGVLPGALVGAVRSQGELKALPLHPYSHLPPLFCVGHSSYVQRHELNR